MTRGAGRLHRWRCRTLVFLLLITAPVYAYGQPEALTRDHRQGTALFKAGKFEAAIPFLERTLSMSVREFGPMASRTGFVMKNLATVHETAGNLDRAAGLYRRAVNIFNAALGPDHAVTRETAAQSAKADIHAQTEALKRKPITLTPPSSPKPLTLRKPGNSGWIVQLGAFAARDNANEAARYLGATLRNLLNVEPLDIRESRGANNRVYRIRTQTIGDRAAATDLCAQIKARKFQCFVLKNN